MGLFDLLCPSSSHASSDVPAQPVYAAGQPCQNCHQEAPQSSSCLAQIDWPSSLSRPLQEIQQNPNALRWWVDENYLRTQMRARERRHEFPVSIPSHEIQAMVLPDLSLSSFLSQNSIFVGQLRGEGLQLLLDQNPLLRATSLNVIGDTRIYFEEGQLTSNSTLINHFVDLPRTLAREIPVAYHPQTGETYSLFDYLRSELGHPRCHSNSTGPMDGGLSSSDAGAIVSPDPRWMRAATVVGIGYGYLDAGCSDDSSLNPTQEWVLLPYLFDYALALANSEPAASRIDLQRLYQDLLALSNRPQSTRTTAHASSQTLPIRSAQVSWTLTPERVSLPNFLIEFSDLHRADPIQLTAGLNAEGLQSISIRNTIHLDRLYIPGLFHLGETSFRLEAQGPHLSLYLNQLDAHLNPFDLNQNDPAQRGRFHVVSGHIEDGQEINQIGEHVLPGVLLEGDLNHSLRYQLNLRVHFRIEDTQGARYEVSGNLVGHGTLIHTAEGLRPEVGTTSLRLQDFSIQSHENSRLTFSIQNLRLEMSDIPLNSDLGSVPTGFRWNLSFSNSQVPFFQAGRMEGFIPLDTYDPQTQERHNVRDALMSASGWTYQPDFQWSDFLTEAILHLEGRSGARDIDGNLLFSTHFSEDQTRSFRASIALNQLGLPLSQGIELFLNHPQIGLQISTSQEASGLCHISIPQFQVSANAQASSRGNLQGRQRIELASNSRRTLEVDYNPQTQDFSFRNLNLRFLFEQITHPQLVQASRESAQTNPRISSVDIDGRFVGNGSYNFLNHRGRGNLCLTGDSHDVVLRDRRHHQIANPLISNTRWCVNSISRHDASNQILWGNFLLDTTVDFSLLRYFGIEMNLRERARMSHNNFPYSARAYEQIQQLFFGQVLSERSR